MDLYKRKCSVNIGGAEFTGLRVVFKVVKTNTKEPNTLDLKVYNLAENSRKAAQVFGTPIALFAGYEGSVGRIFFGDSRLGDPLREGGNWITHIQCGDGEMRARFSDFSKTFPPGVKYAEVVRENLKALGLGGGNVEAFLTSGAAKLDQFARGYVAKGKAFGNFDDLIRAGGAEWSIQDGQVFVLEPNAVQPGTVILISPETGMVGDPEHSSPLKKTKKPYVRVKSLLRHEFRAGGQVAIKSSSVNGQFKILTVTHTGDTDGQEWYSELEVVSL